MLQAFKRFIERGNVIDLAVAVIIGIAFAAVVKSMTEKVLMPLISVIIGGDTPTFDYTLDLRGKSIEYGAFLTETVNFLIIAFALFIVVKAIEKAQSLGRRKDETETELKVTEVELLEEIRDLLAASGPPPQAQAAADHG